MISCDINSATGKVFRWFVWLCFAVAWAVSVFTVIEEFCMVKACRDTAAFTVFGMNMGIFGIIYFSVLLTLRWNIQRSPWIERIMFAAVFAGFGAELRLLWIQKFIIGAWCPLCVTICIALVSGALVMMVEKFREPAVNDSPSAFTREWLPIAVIMAVVGFFVALAGVRAIY
jgi:hypothetical protein